MANLSLFDLDHTLIPTDSDHEWGRFMVKLGIVDAESFAKQNDRFFADYKAGVLDIHAYLVAAGYRDIEWVKRVAGISYASAIAPGIERTVLISARSGAEPIDRRGVGELRVGVEAKDLVAGILMTPGELSEDAEKELERAGRSISVVCGDQLVAALINTGVGVVSSAAPLHYLDDQLLEELLAG